MYIYPFESQIRCINVFLLFKVVVEKQFDLPLKSYNLIRKEQAFEKQLDLPSKVIQSDWGGEYKPFLSILLKHDSIWTFLLLYALTTWLC